LHEAIGGWGTNDITSAVYIILKSS
jgi:hypothetical protein